MRQQKPVLLSSKETYEIYEKRSVSPYRQAQSPTTFHTTLPASAFPPPPPLRTTSSPNPYVQHSSPYKPYASHSPSVHFDDMEMEKPSPIITKFFPASGVKRPIPIGWIIGIAVAVPIFVVLVLFIAVWLQELGIL